MWVLFYGLNNVSVLWDLNIFYPFSCPNVKVIKKHLRPRRECYFMA